MNYTLAKEIYGNPWFMDLFSFQKYAALLDFVKNGGVMTVNEGEKNNSSYLYDLNTKALVSESKRTIQSNKDIDFISVIKINGAITKNGGASSYGTVDMANMLREFDAMDNVKGHILYSESGGGSANAVKYMTNALENEILKPVVSYVEDMSASAMYYINAFTDHIIANDKDAIIGSIGTMIEFAGFPKKAENKEDGYRYVRVYADDAENKNEEFEQAINNYNFKPIKEKILNPHNDKFKADIKRTRENVRDTELTGSTFKASEVVGTLIDEIGTFEDAVNKVMELSSDNLNNSSININNNKMTKQELKEKHPDVYAEIISEERDRCEAFLEFVEVDAESVKKQITDGNQMTAKFMAEMNKKFMAQTHKSEAREESTKEVKTPQEEEKKVKNEIENFAAAMDDELGLKKEE